MSLQLSPSGRIVTRPLADAGGGAEVVEPEAGFAMAQRPSVAGALTAHPHLTIVPRNEHMGALEALEREIVDAIDEATDTPALGEMVTYEPATKGGKWLFRYVEADGTEPAAFAVDDDRLTPHIRALWWELAEAIEAEGRKPR